MKILRNVIARFSTIDIQLIVSTVNGAEIVLRAGDELFIHKEMPMVAGVKSGTIYIFGGRYSIWLD